MEELHAIPYLREIIIVLIAAGILVPLFNRFKLSPVLGYLAVGFIVGPYGLGEISTGNDHFLHYMTIDSPKDVAHLAEFGIVFLMFMIGLELSPKRLWSMRKMVFGLGTLQVFVTSFLIAAAAYFIFDKTMGVAIVVGACVALSSTAIVMQIMADRRLIATPVGRATFSILLFQDIAVVPMLILIGLLGAGAASGGIGLTVLIALGKAIGAILVLVVLGHYLLRPIFRLAGSAKGAEPFMAVTFLTVIVAAAVTGQAGLSMALGAFLGGLLLAETEYRHAIEVYIEPFKGLLLGLFFMSVGMGIDPGVIRVDAIWIVACVIGMFALKTLIITGLGMMFGLTRGTAVETGLLLGQAGEFAFVIISTALAANVITNSAGQFLLVVAGMSMVMTPLVAMFAKNVGPWLDKSDAGSLVMDTPESIPEMHGHVIIAGFGRVGKAVSDILDAENIPYLALDTDPNIVTLQRNAGEPIIYGDALNGDMIKHCHPELSRAVLITMGSAKISAPVVKNIRQHWPDLPIFVRARDIKAAKELNKAGSTVVVAETIEASLQLASSLLRGIGSNEDVILRRLELSREYTMNRITEDA